MSWRTQSQQLRAPYPNRAPSTQWLRPSGSGSGSSVAPHRQVEKTLHIMQGDRHLPNRQVERRRLLVPPLHKSPCMPWLMVVYPVMQSPLSPEPLTTSLNHSAVG